MQYRERSFAWLLLRTLTPSWVSLAGSLTITLIIISFHMLLLSNRADLFLPHVAGRSDDQLVKIYQSNILEPLNTLFGNSLFGVMSTALLWGLVGWIIYALLDFITTSLREWESGKREITVPRKGDIVHSPLHNQIVIRILWRFLVGVVAVALVIALHPLIVNLLSNDVALLKSSSGMEMLKYLGADVGGWLLILHIYVVLFRLFVFRTRTLGEIIY